MYKSYDMTGHLENIGILDKLKIGAFPKEGNSQRLEVGKHNQKMDFIGRKETMQGLLQLEDANWDVLQTGYNKMGLMNWPERNPLTM